MTVSDSTYRAAIVLRASTTTHYTFYIRTCRMDALAELTAAAAGVIKCKLSTKKARCTQPIWLELKNITRSITHCMKRERTNYTGFRLRSRGFRSYES